MNPANGAYPRGPEQPNGSFFNQRGAVPAQTQGPQPPRPLQAPNAQVNARAERFEKEKQRLMESCFSKTDERGQLKESYITHIRVEEDGQYQSSPPPPDASRQYKKQRVIVIAVKNTAIVQMHKARENDDGTFQIGKTWPFDELQAVQVYSLATARTPQEQQHARYAGDSGLTVIMTKPYYWRCNNVQEKDFFVGSLVRIYHRYAHRLPNLIGFTQQETQQLTASVAAIPPGSRPQMGQNGPPRPQQQPGAVLASPHSSIASSNMGPLTQDPAGTPPPLRMSQQRRPSQPLDVQQRDTRSFQQTPSPTARFQLQPASQVLPQQQYSQPQPPPQFQPQQARSTPPTIPLQQNSEIVFDGANDRRQQQEEVNTSQPFLRPIVTTNAPPPVASNNVMSALSPSAVSPGTQNLSSMTTSRWRPEVVNAVPPRAFTESPGSEHSPGTTSSPPRLDTQIVPERRRPPLLDGVAAESQRSIRAATDGIEPSPLGTQPTMQIPATSANYTDDPLPEVLPLRTSGTYSSPQKPKAPVVTQQEPGRALSPAPEVQRAQSPDAASIDSNNSRDERQYRPGLGPMTKSTGDTANKLRKAATALNAFKPRAGGAGERLLGTKAAANDEPDGVTRVVPAPLKRAATQDVVPAMKSPKSIDNSVRPLSLRVEKSATPAPNGPISPTSPTGPPQPAINVPTVEVNNEQNTRRVSKTVTPKPRKQTDFFTKSLAMMQIDSSLVNGQHLEYENVLSEFNWDTNLLQVKQIDVLKTNIRRDIARLEAGSWLGDSEHKDDRVAMVEHLLNQSIAECDEMEGLLTLYSVELSTLNEDVAYIEAQSQGLQVQTANQKLLHNELQSLIATISLDASQLEPLKRAPLGDLQGLEAIEGALLLLYRALQTIDPALLGRDGMVAQGWKDEQALSSMRALQEKKSLYLNEAHGFLTRIRQYAEPTFAMAFQKARESLSRNSTSSRTSQVDLGAHDIARASLWQLRPLMIFAEEIDRNAWEDIIATYVTQARGTYHSEIQEMVAQWKKGTRVPSSEEQDALFTAQEKEVDGLAGTARRLTVKRSQTLARITRSAAVEKRAAISRNQENKQPYEAFAGALEETVPLIFTEQNFIVDFFHSKSLESTDFVEAVTASRPAERRGTNLLTPRRLIEGDRAMSQKLRGLMEGVFPTWQNELSGLLEWALADPFQGIGILCALERKRLELEDTNQEFIVRSINKIYERLSISFNQFVDGQIRAIDETKVKINKRKGVIAFIKVFPNFSTIVESMLPPADGPERLETRSMVDEAYNRIIRSMFDSLKTIARATPAAAPAMSADPEDKEALNHHILLIENMFHFYNELDEHGDPALGEWRGKAMLMMSEHQELYLNAIIRRPLGKLLDFLDSVENLIGRGLTPASIPSSHPSHSRSVYKKTLNSYDAKEIKRGIETLRKRIDKHFSEADDAAISAELLKRITSECERKYNDVCERANRAAGEIYEGSVQVEFTKMDVAQAFRR